MQLLDWEKQRRPPEVSHPRKTWSVEASKIEGLNRLSSVVMSQPRSQGSLKQERESRERVNVGREFAFLIRALL